MADPDGDSDEDFEDSPDYYSILNVRKEATEEEIKAAYKRLCVLYHPDKHFDAKNKQTAEVIFSKLNKAYKVLSTPEQRIIYDIYGQKGLDAGWEVVERKRTPQEVREEYERLQREADERRIERKTNPTGSITLRIDATDIFNKEDNDDPYYQDESSFLPNIEIRGMSIRQSIDAPITTDDTVVLSGDLSHINGNGTGNVNMCMRRLFSQKAWGECEISAGDGPRCRIKGFRNINKKTFGTISLNSSLVQAKLTAGLQAMVARQLTKNTMGYITWMGGSMSALSSVVTRNTEKYHFMAQVQLGMPHSFAAVSYTRKFQDEGSAKVSLKFGLLGLMLDYGCETKVTSLSRMGAYMSIGQVSGVTLKIKIHRHTQTFNFPILLCDEVSPAAVFYGTITPIITYLTVKAIAIAPMMKRQRAKKVKETREKHAQLIKDKRKEAEDAIQLMLMQYERTVEMEQNKHGLVILEAWYGRFVSKNERATDTTSQFIINVTVPIQCSVKDSKLLLTNASKYQLSGFYDPCMGEDKYLKIVYEFRDAVHEAIYEDNEPVRIPKQSHRISSKIS